MALVVKDRVKETSTTTGTGVYTLAGASAGFQAFSAIGNANTTPYCATDGTNWEVGVGTYTLSGTTLARTTVLQSSNSGAAVNWGAGTRTIFCTLAVDRGPLGTGLTSGQIWLGDSSNAAAAVTPSGDVTITNAGVTSLGASAFAKIMSRISMRG